jgi:hypothetical protein
MIKIQKRIPIPLDEAKAEAVWRCVNVTRASPIDTSKLGKALRRAAVSYETEVALSATPETKTEEETLEQISRLAGQLMRLLYAPIDCSHIRVPGAEMKLKAQTLTLENPSTTVRVEFREKVTDFIGLETPKGVSVCEEQLAEDGLLWTATLTAHDLANQIDQRRRAFWLPIWPPLNEIVRGLQKLEEGAKKVRNKAWITRLRPIDSGPIYF